MEAWSCQFIHYEENYDTYVAQVLASDIIKSASSSCSEDALKKWKPYIYISLVLDHMYPYALYINPFEISRATTLVGMDELQRILDHDMEEASAAWPHNHILGVSLFDGISRIVDLNDCKIYVYAPVREKDPFHHHLIEECKCKIHLFFYNRDPGHNCNLIMSFRCSCVRRKKFDLDSDDDDRRRFGNRGERLHDTSGDNSFVERILKVNMRRDKANADEQDYEDYGDVDDEYDDEEDEDEEDDVEDHSEDDDNGDDDDAEEEDDEDGDDNGDADGDEEEDGDDGEEEDDEDGDDDDGAGDDN